MSLRYFMRFLKPQTTRVAVFRGAASKENDVVIYDSFADIEKKNKKTYLDMLKIFENNDTRRRGHVEFIYAALKYMKEFGVHKDLEVYKSLLEVLPKGRFIPTNIFQAEFMHYPKQQQCAVDVLEQMEDNGVMPDSEMEDILLSVFGKRGIPLRKFWRMMYWMPKFRNLSPWRLPQEMPGDPQHLARLAIERICSVDINMKITTFETSDVEASIDNTWIISAQSPTQKILLSAEATLQREAAPLAVIDGPPVGDVEPLVVRGAFRVYLRDQVVSYFMLTGPVRQRVLKKEDLDDVSDLEVSMFGISQPPALLPSVHEQDDGTILAVCATGTSSRDSLLSWIRLLEKNGNPGLSDLPVIFTLTAPPNDVIPMETQAAVREETNSEASK